MPDSRDTPVFLRSGANIAEKKDKCKLFQVHYIIKMRIQKTLIVFRMFCSLKTEQKTFLNHVDSQNFNR